MQLVRFIRHLLIPAWWPRRNFPPTLLRDIEVAVGVSERRHCGELRFVIEADLPLGDLWRDVTTRQRAIEVFSRLRVWDTEHNSGVLIYVQLIDRRVEIVADRGIDARVAQAEWDAVARLMEAAFRAGDFRHGSLEAIEQVTRLLVEHFPAATNVAANPNELPDRPAIL